MVVVVRCVVCVGRGGAVCGVRCAVCGAWFVVRGAWYSVVVCGVVMYGWWWTVVVLRCGEGQ